MRIEKFKKTKNGQYELTLIDNTTISIHEDLILKYNLLITKTMDETQKKRILKENEIYIAYDKALKYLNAKMRSTNEMNFYLRKQEYDEKIINNVIDKLIGEKYLDDEKYTLYFINDKIKLSNDGPLKIERELEQKGINSDIISKHIIKFNQIIQKEKIEKIIKKQVKNNHNKSSTMLKRKILDYLINLGYEKNIINTILNKIYNYDDETIRQKEYEKIYKKLSGKYSGYELEQRLKQKMYEKGFRY